MATLPTMINQDRGRGPRRRRSTAVWGAALTLILLILVLNLLGGSSPLQHVKADRVDRTAPDVASRPDRTETD